MNHAKVRKRSRKDSNIWQLLLEEKEQSTLSVRAFCQDKGLTEDSYYSWRKRLMRKSYDGLCGLVRQGLFPVSWKSTRKTLVETVCKEKMQISLLSGNGKILPQFPLAGTTEFTVVDLLGDGKPVVVTANGDRMVAYSIE